MKKHVIICVDDEAMVLDSLSLQLKNILGNTATVEFAESATEAMELINELEAEGQQVTLLISDWLMPGMKGDELLIKVHNKFPNMKKVLLTGQADANAKKRVTALPGMVIHKPWSEQDLKKALS